MPRLIEKVAMWFAWEGDPDHAEVEIVNLTDEEKASITEKAKTVKMVFEPKTGTPRYEHTFAEREDRALTAILSVKNWKNFFDADGQPMECSSENKRTWACNNAFMEFLNAKRLIVEAEAERQAGEKRKN